MRMMVNKINPKGKGYWKSRVNKERGKGYGKRRDKLKIRGRWYWSRLSMNSKEQSIEWNDRKRIRRGRGIGNEVKWILKSGISDEKVFKKNCFR